LWYKTVAHGRAFGNGKRHPDVTSEWHLICINPGVYFAKDGTTSFSSYAHGGSTWKNSQLYPQSCAALAEIVNLPEKFVSNHPHYVVADTTWIVWCVLLDTSAQSVDLHVK
jgi:ubiquitin-conjugating enzyme E2 Q